MAYVTARELRAVVPDEYRDAALADQGEQPDPGLLAAVIEAACREVDALIEGRVRLPLSEPYPQKIITAAKYFALEILFTRRGVEMPEATAKKVAWIRSDLGKVGAGDLRLEAPAEQTAESRASSGSIVVRPSITGTGGMIGAILLLFSCLAHSAQAVDSRTFDFVAPTNPLIESADYMEWSQAESVRMRYRLPAADSTREARWEISDATNLWLNLAPTRSGTLWTWNPAPTQTCLPAGRYVGRVAVYARTWTNLTFHRILAFQDIRVHPARDPQNLVFASPLDTLVPADSSAVASNLAAHEASSNDPHSAAGYLKSEETNGWEVGSHAAFWTNGQPSIYVGNTNQSAADPGIGILRSVSATNRNARGFIDHSSVLIDPTYSYAGFDAGFAIQGTNIGHVIGVQVRPGIYLDGKMGNIYGYWSFPALNSGTATNYYGVKVSSLSGTGINYNAYGFYADEMVRGTSNNYAFYSAGTTPSRFGAIALGTNNAISNWPSAVETLSVGGDLVAALRIGSTNNGALGAYDVANDLFRYMIPTEDGWKEVGTATNALWYSANNGDRPLAEWAGRIGDAEAFRVARVAERYAQSISLDGGYVTVWSTGNLHQFYSAAGASTVRVSRPSATLSNAAAVVFHVRLWTNYTVFATNNLLGFTTTGIYTNGFTNTVFIDWQPNSTSAYWKVLH